MTTSLLPCGINNRKATVWRFNLLIADCAKALTHGDHEEDEVKVQNILELIFYKRIQSSHEKELRAVIWKQTTNEIVIDPFAMAEPDSAELGLVIPVALDSLIVRIIVAPTTPTWFTKLVESVCTKYELDCPITQSVLSDAPLR